MNECCILLFCHHIYLPWPWPTCSSSLLLTDLSVVGGDDGDAVGGVAQQPHVLEHRHHVLRLAKVLRVGEGAR